MKELLVEKYRPQEFKDLVGCPKGIEEVVNSKSIPHFLFEGVQGSGKTTISKMIAKKLDADLLLLNASKDRGIDVIRNVIEPFAKKKSSKIKIVMLDEMDATTPQFQTALRNFMETYSHSTRFIGTCNTISKVIKPLQSRFSKYTFGGYDKEEVFKRIKFIVNEEKIDIDDETIKKLINKFKDDIRRSINFLDQHRNNKITIDMISQETKAIHVLKELLKGRWYELRQELSSQNIDYDELLVEIDKIVFNHSKIPIDVKRNINIMIARGMYEMNFTINKEISFASVLANIQDGLKW